MDLNYLYSRHQIALIKARAAVCPMAHTTHLSIARQSAAEVNARRRGLPSGSAAAL